MTLLFGFGLAWRWSSAAGERNSERPKSRKRRRKKKRSRPYEISGREFVRRWSMHLLPKGFTRSRSYGGYHPSKRANYLLQTRTALALTDEPEITDTATEIATENDMPPAVPTCCHCKTEMICIENHARPSWKQVFERSIYAPNAPYSPMHHLATLRPSGYG